MDPDSILTGLDPEQREVATALRGPVCVLAGAGTGKTRAITHRIGYGVASGVYQPNQVLALTFTARAAGEMRTRLAALGVGGVQARTFHAAALRQLHYFWPKAFGGAAPPLVDHKARLVGEAVGRLRLRADRTVVRDLAAEIEWAKVSMLVPADYPAAATAAGRSGAANLDLVTVARVLQAYEDVKTARGVIDFEDVLQLTIGVLRDNPQIAETVRGQYRHFVVDEYQDVSTLQQALLDVWLGDRDEVCVVGDASQTIYSFAGADPRYLLDFGTRFPRAQRITLVRDYRSTPEVVDLANRLLDAAPPAARVARVQLVAQRDPGPTPEFTSYPDDLAEAAAVAERVVALQQAGTPATEVAVLYRTNGQSEPLEQALSDAGVGYQVRGGERFFARAEVRRAIMLLRGAARSGSPGLLGDQVRDVLAAAGWTPTAPTNAGAARDQWESLQALTLLADDIAAVRPSAALADLVAELDARAAAAHAPSAGGVTLATLHAAKGLEWDAVFIVGLSEGLLPISFASTVDEIEEERRLLYVGVTRARERLYLSWTDSRTPGGRRARGPSSFLAALVGRRRAAGSGRSGSRRERSSVLHKVCRSCRKTLSSGAEKTIGRCADCPPDYDEGLYEALRQWRIATAAQAGVPAYVVFTAATLQAIAAARPGDRPGLHAIAGVGLKKLELYADPVIALIADHRADAVSDAVPGGPGRTGGGPGAGPSG